MKAISLHALITLLVLLSACTQRIDNEELSKYWWKYGDGYHFKDVLVFDNGKKETSNLQNWISNDTIYFDNKPELRVLNTYNRINGNIVLTVTLIDRYTISYYHNKGLRQE